MKKALPILAVLAAAGLLLRARRKHARPSCESGC